MLGIVGTTSGGFTSDCRPATLSPEEFARVAKGQIPQEAIDRLTRSSPDGIPQDFFVDVQRNDILDFILSEVPDAGTV